MNNEIPMNCPYCVTRGKTADRGGHLYVNRSKRLYHCFRCGASGRVTAKMKLMDKSLEEICQQDPFFGLRRAAASELPAHDFLSDYAYRYLTEEREVGWHVIESMPIYSTDTGVLFVFPDGGWQERRWRDEPRWLFPKGFNGRCYVVEPAPDDNGVVFVEGIIDALKVATAGYNVAAVLSHSVSGTQAAALSQSYSEAQLMFDADVGTAELIKANGVLNEHFDYVELVPLVEGDPADMTVQQIKDKLQ